MQFFLQLLFNGLSVAGVYALLAAGVTLIFGLTGIVNFAHGQFFMLAAYVTWYVSERGSSFIGAAAVAVLLLTAVGFGLERGVFRFTMRRPITGFIVSLGLIPFIGAIVIQLWGTIERDVPPPISSVWAADQVLVPAQRVVVISTTLVVCVALFAVLRYTQLGRSLRAAANNRAMASALGINVTRLVTIAFIIGSAIAGVGGALVASLYPITPELGTTFVFKAFAIALIGGLGNVVGAMLAALLVAASEAMVAGYLSSDWSDVFVLVAMLVILLVRPNGLFRGTEGSSVV